MNKEILKVIGQLQYEISLLEHSKEELTGVTNRTEELKDLVKKLIIPVVSNSLSDLDGKTVLVKFKVTKFKPNIILDIDLANDC